VQTRNPLRRPRWTSIALVSALALPGLFTLLALLGTPAAPVEAVQPPEQPINSPPAAPVAADDPVLLAAGDIAACGRPGSEQTAALLDRLPGTVLALGDNAYQAGTDAEFAQCYSPTWGRHRARTRPVPGNHEYDTPGAVGYFGYFGAAAAPPDKGYYSYDVGDWHIVALNSNCSQIGGCQIGSPQERWLRADLAAHPTRCTLAYWHHPRFNSGKHGNDAEMQPIWQTLYDAGADVVLSGHEHSYERFAPQDAAGAADPERGIRQFTVGTGGASHHALGRPIANSELQNADAFGVLKLMLHPAGYDWEFVPVAGATFTDSGHTACH